MQTTNSFHHSIAIPAELVSKYEITALLGEGGMGVVYAARHKITGRHVAIKLLRQEQANNATAHLRFKQEAEAASKLSHPNVTQVFDFGVSSDGLEYLILEYVSGKNLAEIVRERPLQPEEFIEFFTQICSGLAHAHRNGIIHRDLKPSNILISRREGEPDLAKIADFGIAKITTDGTTQHLTKTGEICGSPLYMSPEQCTGRPADIRSDIFALGCMMYESITGAVPNAGENTLETIHRRTSEQARPFCDAGISFPPGIEAVVLRCLAIDPSQRYQSVEELQDELQHALTSKSNRAPRAHNRKPAALIVCSVAPALAILGLVGFTLLRAQPPVSGDGEKKLPPHVVQSGNRQRNPQVEAAAKERLQAERLMGRGDYSAAKQHLKKALISLKAAPHDEAFTAEWDAFTMSLTSLLAQPDHQLGLQPGGRDYRRRSTLAIAAKERLVAPIPAEKIPNSPSPAPIIGGGGARKDGPSPVGGSVQSIPAAGFDETGRPQRTSSASVRLDASGSGASQQTGGGPGSPAVKQQHRLTIEEATAALLR